MQPTDTIDRDSLRSDIPDFRAGDTVKVHVRVVEGNRERVQVFQGAVMRRQGGGVQETFTGRKVSFGVSGTGRRRRSRSAVSPGARRRRRPPRTSKWSKKSRISPTWRRSTSRPSTT